MTTPTPQDIATAEEIALDIDRMGFPLLSKMIATKIATTLAAERSYWQAECERLQASVNLWKARGAEDAAENARLRDNLKSRDDFLVSIDRWTAYTDSLPRAQPATAERE